MLWARMVVHYIVDARRTFERRDRSGCGVIDMDEAVHSWAIADYRHLLPANLLSHIARIRVPGPRPVKKSVTHRSAFDSR